MNPINCPLCCTETFTSQFSLKAHIHETLDKLKCPYCDKKFREVRRLALHLDKDCPLTTKTNCEEISSEDPLKILPSDQEIIQDDPNTLATNLKGEENPPENENNIDTYFCQICAIYFEDIDAHLRQFHEGQDVIVQEEGEDATGASAEVDAEPEAEASSKANSIDEENAEIKEPEDVPEERFQDKDGRHYTRKYVKIDKFWLENKNINDPITQKYIVEGGEVKKISEQDENQLDDKSQVILIHQCPDCDLLFPELDNYKRHECDKTGTVSKFKCSYCSKFFNNFDNFKVHLKAHSKKSKLMKVMTIGSLNCDICNTNFPTFKSLRLHKRMHDPIKSREPDPPVTYAADLATVSRHEDCVDLDSKDMFICNVCNKTYHRQYEEAHMESHNSVDDEFNCNICNRKFFTESNLSMHMKAHSNNKKFACSYCKKPFVTFDALSEHLSNQCQKRLYACQYCGRRFSRPHEKVKHERIHTGEKPHVCEICNKAFRVSYCLTLHMRTHSGSRPYQCSHCGKRFKSHSAFNHHTQTHSDVRAYKCPFCPKAFKTSVQLAGHKNSHTKPFSCTECNRPYSSLYAVRAHMETHKRDNNLRYECWMCGAKYSRTFALRDHLKHHHQQTDVVIDKNNTVTVLKTKAETADDDDDDDDDPDGEHVEEEEDDDAANSMLVKEDEVVLEFDGGANVEVVSHQE